MTYQEVRNAARANMQICKACPECNGKACANLLPGPGAKGSGESAVRNYQAWRDIYLNMDTIGDDRQINTTYNFFGYEMQYPVFAAPMGAVSEHFGDKLTQREYDEGLTAGCCRAGIAAFTGDGLHDEYFPDACAAIQKSGFGVVTIKPWSKERVFERIDIAKSYGVKVMCMDIDGSGLPFLRNTNPPSGCKTLEQLREIVEYAGVPFLLKGIMTPEAALKAKAAGAAGIVVSNHGGRVLDQTPATAWVLPKIADAVNGEMTVLVDGGIRTGLDVFKALALGADGVLIGRPFAACVYGAGTDGICAYVHKIGEELQDAMRMCGPRTLGDIGLQNIWNP